MNPWQQPPQLSKKVGGAGGVAFAFLQSKHFRSWYSQSAMFWSRPACLYRVFMLSISACFKFGSQTATKSQAVTISLPTGWHNTPSSSGLDRIRASRCGGWRTSTWCPSQRTCMGVFTPATPTSSWTQSNSALGTCSTISTSGWVSEGVKSGRPESAANAPAFDAQ